MLEQIFCCVNFMFACNFLLCFITYFQPSIVPSQQKGTSTTSVQLPLQTDAIYPGDVSSKCATPKIAKSLPPMQLRRSNKLSNHRNLFKHMTLSKTFLSRTADGSDKIKMDAVTTEDKEMLKREHSSPHYFDRGKHFPMEAKTRDGSASIRSGEILEGEDSKEVQEVDVNRFVDKRRVRKKTLVRSLTVHVLAASNEQSKSISGSKIALGKVFSVHMPFSSFRSNASDAEQTIQSSNRALISAFF